MYITDILEEATEPIIKENTLLKSGSPKDRDLFIIRDVNNPIGSELERFKVFFSPSTLHSEC